MAALSGCLFFHSKSAQAPAFPKSVPARRAKRPCRHPLRLPGSTASLSHYFFLPPPFFLAAFFLVAFFLVAFFLAAFFTVFLATFFFVAFLAIFFTDFLTAFLAFFFAIAIHLID